MRVPRLLAVLLAGALLVPAAPARADDAASLLAKHRAFVGWQFGDGSVRSLELDRAYTNAKGKVTQHARELRIGLAYRRDYESTRRYEGNGAQGFTGRVFWTTSDNGFTVPIIGDAAKLYLSFDALFMEGTSELPATLHGQGTIDGKSYPIVRVTMNGALPIDLYVDPDTGAYVRAVVDPGGSQETELNVASYATLAPGKKIIGSWSFGSATGKYAYTKVTLNPQIPAEDLHPPIPTASWSFKNDKPFPIKVTPGRVYVDATVNGVPGTFILDTGAAGIVLTDDFANKAHVKAVDHSRSFGIGGITKNLVRTADTVEIGGNTLSHVIVSSLNEDLNDARYNEFHLAGLMGFDLFAASIVHLNLSNATMQIQDPATTTVEPNGGVPINVDLLNLVPTVPARIDDKLQINAILDTGGFNLVLISSEAPDHGAGVIANRDAGFLGGDAEIGGVAGSEMVTCGRLGHITIGPFVYGDLEACESHNWSLHEGLIGFDFLQHFDYIFDYPQGQLIMSPHKE